VICFISLLCLIEKSLDIETVCSFTLVLALRSLAIPPKVVIVVESSTKTSSIESNDKFSLFHKSLIVKHLWNENFCEVGR